MPFRPMESVGATLAMNAVLFMGPGHGHVPEADWGTYHNVRNEDTAVAVAPWQGTHPVASPDKWSTAIDTTTDQSGDTRTDFPESSYTGHGALADVTDQAAGLAQRYNIRIRVTANADSPDIIPGSEGDVEASQALAEQASKGIEANLHVDNDVPITATGVDALGKPNGAVWEAGDEKGIRIEVDYNNPDPPKLTKCERDATVVRKHTETNYDIETPIIGIVPIFRRKKNESESGAVESQALQGEIIDKDRGGPVEPAVVNGEVVDDQDGGRSIFIPRFRMPRLPRFNLRLPNLPRPSMSLPQWEINPRRWGAAAVLLGAVALAALGSQEYKGAEFQGGLCKKAGEWSMRFCGFDTGNSTQNDSRGSQPERQVYIPAEQACPDATEYITHVTVINTNNGQPAPDTHEDRVGHPKR
ncbi:MAG TPA: hypothetical protein VLI54_03365 [Bacillota bacterium]|nr:hypothetical protein [Bacillota bacterium]